MNWLLQRLSDFLDGVRWAAIILIALMTYHWLTQEYDAAARLMPKTYRVWI